MFVIKRKMYGRGTSDGTAVCVDSNGNVIRAVSVDTD